MWGTKLLPALLLQHVLLHLLLLPIAIPYAGWFSLLRGHDHSHCLLLTYSPPSTPSGPSLPGILSELSVWYGFFKLLNVLSFDLVAKH